jgi:23S rRNA pseudouridine1911/1915/1917 synthase
MTASESLRVATDDAGQRLDRYLAGKLPTMSRSRIQSLIESGDVLLNGQPAQPAKKVAAGDAVDVTVPEPQPAKPQPEEIPLTIVYEDSDLIVIDKPAGMVVHPAPGHPSGTLVNAVLSHTPDLRPIGGELRPGIVHRLDRDTSGLLVIAKNEPTLRFLQAQLKQRLGVDKRYLTLVDGGPQPESGTIDAPIGRDPRRPQQMAAVATGRPSVTHFRVLQRYDHHTLLECKPVTGRTHQIRVHLSAIGCPVAGDRVYGRKRPSIPLNRHFLHATRLTFHLPSGEERTFDAPLPPELQAVLTSLAG